MRQKEVAHHQERIDSELNALAGRIDTGVLEVLLEIQKELGYKWSFFSGLMPSSLAFYVCGITNINPLLFDLKYQLYCNAKSDLNPSITIELPPSAELTDYNHIAEKYGYMIVKEETPKDADFELYSFVNLGKINNEESWVIHKSDVKVQRNNVVYLINLVFRVMHNPMLMLMSMRIDPLWNIGWDRIANGAILKYFKELPVELIDFYFDYKVNDFKKLANFLVYCKINEDKSMMEFTQKMRNYHLKLNGESSDEQVISSNTNLMKITTSLFGIFMAAMDKGYIQAYNLFLLSHLEHCYPLEFKKGMENTSFGKKFDGKGSK